MSQGKDWRTRKKVQGQWQGSRSNEQLSNLRGGLCGLFFTVDGDEKRAVREAYNLIEDFLISNKQAQNINETSNDQNNLQNSDSSKDVSDSLKASCQEVRRFESLPFNNIRQFGTGARCSLFFTSSIICRDNVYMFAEQMVEKCQKITQNRFLARVVPVEETCPATMDQILPSLSAMIQRHLVSYSSAVKPPTFAVDFKSSNSKLLAREQMYTEVNKLMKEHSPDSSVNLTQPDFLIFVHVIKTVALLAIIGNYYQKHKYALRLPNEETKEKKSEPVTEKSDGIAEL